MRKIEQKSDHQRKGQNDAGLAAYTEGRLKHTVKVSQTQPSWLCRITLNFAFQESHQRPPVELRFSPIQPPSDPQGYRSTEVKTDEAPQKCLRNASKNANFHAIHGARWSDNANIRKPPRQTSVSLRRPNQDVSNLIVISIPRRQVG